MSNDPGNPNVPSHKQRPRQPQTWGRVLRRCFCYVLAGAVVAGGGAFYLARSQPAVWKERQAVLRQTTPQQRKERAEQFQKRISEQLRLDQFKQRIVAARAGQRDADGRLVRPDDLMVITMLHMTTDEINDWMESSLADWMAYKGYELPTQVSSPVLAIRDQRFILAFEYRSDNFAQVFTARCNMRINDEGRAQLALDGATAGNLPLPTGVVGSAMESTPENAPGGGAIQQAGQFIRKLDGFEFSPVFPVDQDVKVRVLAHRFVPDGLALTVRLEPRGADLPPPSPAQIAAVRTN